MMLPPSLQGSLPAGWLAVTGRESNPLDHDERFPSCYISSPLPGFILTLRHPKPVTEAEQTLHRSSGDWCFSSLVGARVHTERFRRLGSNQTRLHSGSVSGCEHAQSPYCRASDRETHALGSPDEVFSISRVMVVTRFVGLARLGTLSSGLGKSASALLAIGRELSCLRPTFGHGHHRWL